MSSFIEDLDATRLAEDFSPRCGVGKALFGIDDPEIRKQIEFALYLKNPPGTRWEFTYPAQWLKRALKHRGIHVGIYAVRNHRTGGCGCDDR